MNKTVLGIDFGTTNSCISYYLNKRIFQVVNENGNYITPSSVYFDEYSDNILYGEHANEMCNKPINKSNIISCFKRLLGIKYDKYIESDFSKSNFKNINIIKSEKTNLCAIRLIHNNKEIIYEISELIEMYLTYLIKLADVFIGDTIRDVVITIPAYFSDIQRTIFKNSCENIGLNVIRVLNEPTAAGLAYAFDESFKQKVDEETVLIIDCGGGTTDISLIEIDYDDMSSVVIDVNGDNFLGGEDFTNEIIQFIINKIKLYKKSFDIPSKKQYEKIKRIAEDVKISLTYKFNALVYLENIVDENDITFNISRIQFIDICKEYFEKIKKMVKDVKLRNRGVQIDKIILAGGSSRIPNFENLLKGLFDNTINTINNIQICNKLNPDTLISIGAAYQGAVIYNLFENSKYNNSVLIDVIPFSLGIKTAGNLMTTIISKNTPIPVSKYEIFTNIDDNDDSITIEVYSGESRFIKDNELLSVFKLENLDNTLKANEMKIKVTFEVNTNGMIFIEAEEMKSKIKKEILITKTYECDVSCEKDYHDKFEEAEQESKILKILEFKNSLRFFDTLKDKIKKIDNELTKILDDYEKYTNEEIDKMITSFKNDLGI